MLLLCVANKNTNNNKTKEHVETNTRIQKKEEEKSIISMVKQKETDIREAKTESEE